MEMNLTETSNVIVAIASAPLLNGLIKAAKARLQNRRGPRLLQGYFDIRKWLHKDAVVSPTTSWIFAAAPYVYLAATVAATVQLFAMDFIVMIYLLASGRFFLVLASLDAGSAFGGMGGAREMFIAALVEPALLLAAATLALPAQSTQMALLTATAESGSIQLSQLLAAIAFYLVLVAETGRIPVDNPDTHLELTMIHEGMILEYSGHRLALIHLAAALKQLLFIVLFCQLFLPWGDAAWLAVKVMLVALLLALTETSTNKMRLFKVPEFLMLSGLISLLALLAQ
ncbi:respiratory chain complex I subunit 1 family protein [Azotosporobacter soli]|uniref:respiratory chain complex I subunit 1 family protein n=1 Tax=Azotosporobacter soli TaxID=3055040 RepID=UPI0031FE5E1F